MYFFMFNIHNWKIASDTDSVDTDFDDPEVDEVLEVDEAEEKKMNKKVSLLLVNI